MSLQYLIRFQNTGNDTAYSVRLEDDLSSQFDFETFEPLSWSHPCQSILDEDGKLQVYFDDIFLADSTTNEPESHGYYRFRIRTNDNLNAGEVIENTVGIYFDFNDPVITNTTSNSVFDCSELASFTMPNLQCAYESFDALSLQDHIETYEWTFDDAIISTESMHTLTLPTAGEYEVVLSVSNPLCAESSSQIIEILPGVSPNAGADFSICDLEGELQAIDDGIQGFWTYPQELVLSDASLATSAVSATSYGEFELLWNQSVGACAGSDNVVLTFLSPIAIEIQQTGEQLEAIVFNSGPFDWYLDGVLVATTENGLYTPTVSGSYTVEIVGLNGCPSLSDAFEFVISGLDEFGLLEVLIAPSPFSTELTIELAEQPQEMLVLELRDALGRLQRISPITGQRTTLSRDGLAIGTYQLSVRAAEGQIVYSQKVTVLD